MGKSPNDWEINRHILRPAPKRTRCRHQFSIKCNQINQTKRALKYICRCDEWNRWEKNLSYVVQSNNQVPQNFQCYNCNPPLRRAIRLIQRYVTSVCQGLQQSLSRSAHHFSASIKNPSCISASFQRFNRKAFQNQRIISALQEKSLVLTTLVQRH